MKSRHLNLRTRLALVAAAAAALSAGLLAPISMAPPATAHTNAPSVTGCQVKATLNGVLTWHHFNRPFNPCELGNGSTDDRHITNEVIRLINDTPAGSTIRGNFASLKDPDTMAALQAAYTRGVTLYLTLPNGEGSTDYPTEFQSIGGRLCWDASGGTSCNGTNANGTAHTKALTFSATKDPDGVAQSQVTWIGSANPASTSGGTRGFNNAMTSYGDAGLYNGVNGVLADMYASAANGGWANYYDGTRGYVNGTSANVLASPEPDTDFAATRLAQWSANANCEARVAQTVFRRVAVAEQLKRLANGGCTVYVASEEYTQAVVDVLKSSTGYLRVRQVDNIHDKTMVVKGNAGAGQPVSYRVYAGSHNLNDPAQLYNDEMFVIMQPEGATHPVYDAYAAHFGPQGPWSQSTTCPTKAVVQAAGGCYIYK
jgi:hypothetical protein